MSKLDKAVGRISNPSYSPSSSLLRRTEVGAVVVPVSPGELIDKLTILEIKSERITDPAKLAQVRAELALLEKAFAESIRALPAIASLRT